MTPRELQVENTKSTEDRLIAFDEKLQQIEDQFKRGRKTPSIDMDDQGVGIPDDIAEQF